MLTKELEDITVALTDAGLHKNQALTLVAVASRDRPVKSKEIQRWADLQQPEVSVAAKQLELRKWIVVEPIITGEPGRPRIEYKLAKPLSEILTEFLQEVSEEVKRLSGLRRRLKQYAERHE